MINCIKKTDKNFPQLLKEIPHPPNMLFYKGEPIGEEQKVAIVGTRRASEQGKAFARDCAKILAQYGITVVSGLALGIDGAAHEGALDAGGKTIAVLAHGLDTVYPRSHLNLAKRIIESGGTLVSEYPEKERCYPGNFIARNRIISGLCAAVIIAEAPKTSGSLATARFAVEQNRDVYVVPGPVKSPLYEGSHQLLKEGASLITSAYDVLKDLGVVLQEDEADHSLPILNDERQQVIFNTIKEAANPIGVDKIAEITKIAIPELNRAISIMVIQGIIKENRGKYYV